VTGDQLEAAFAAIIERALSEASAIDCTLEEYVEGLSTMYATVEVRYHAAMRQAQQQAQEDD
jgi:hypothetical protein